MEKGYGVYWRRLGGIEKAFLISVLLYAILYATRLSSTAQSLAALAVFCMGMLTVFRVARRGMRKAIWRLRNRLIAAYLFIAVVPIVLIVAMVGLASWMVIGQMAVYLVNKELEHREVSILRQADGFANIPMSNPEVAVTRFERTVRNSFPQFELLITGKHDVRYPEGARITHPPPAWKHASGLIVKHEAMANIFMRGRIPSQAVRRSPSSRRSIKGSCQALCRALATSPFTP